MGKLFRAFGLLPTEKLVIKSALDMTSGFVGQSKDKVEAVMTEALGGILFIDEAYNLGGQGFGQEAQDKLLQLLTEDKFKNKLVVILAGYKDKMESMFEHNAGFKSRFACTVNFPDWDDTSLCNLVINGAKNMKPAFKFENENDAAQILSRGLREIRSNDLKSWANARDATTLLTLITKEHFLHIGSDDRAISNVLTRRNLTNAVNRFLDNRPFVAIKNPMARANDMLQFMQQSGFENSRPPAVVCPEIVITPEDDVVVEDVTNDQNDFDELREQVLEVKRALEKGIKDVAEKKAAEQELVRLRTLQDQINEKKRREDAERRRLEKLRQQLAESARIKKRARAGAGTTAVGARGKTS